MKRAIIVHCWDGYPEYCWYQSTKKELEQKGFEVTIPSFPDTHLPELSKWLPVLQEVIGTPDQETYLIGHSVGCITILRYLESLSPEQKIGGAVLVAGYTDSLQGIVGIKSELVNFFTTPILYTDIKQKAEHFVVIHSDDDMYVDLKYGDEFKEKLGAELIIKHGMGHFSGDMDDTKSCTSLPDITEAILKMDN